MIGYLKGKILYNNSTSHFILLVGGVGYRVETMLPEKFGLEGMETEAFIYTHVSENDLRLFGFSSTLEQELFEKLISVSGVGPKTGLQIIGNYSPAQLVAAIKSGAADSIKVKGVGAKTVAKIIIELKGRLDELELKHKELRGDSADLSADARTNSSTANMFAQSELESALTNLGFSPNDIKKVIPQVPLNLAFADQLRKALSLIRSI